MTNRIARFIEEEPAEDSAGDFFVVAGEFGAVCVDRETAARVEAVLDRWLVPTWVVIGDRSGSRLRIRTRQIRSIVESTAAQRAADRRFDRARQREEDDRRPWERDE